jgi:hypothetical protein
VEWAHASGATRNGACPVRRADRRPGDSRVSCRDLFVSKAIQPPAINRIDAVTQGTRSILTPSLAGTMPLSSNYACGIETKKCARWLRPSSRFRSGLAGAPSWTRQPAIDGRARRRRARFAPAASPRQPLAAIGGNFVGVARHTWPATVVSVRGSRSELTAALISNRSPFNQLCL